MANSPPVCRCRGYGYGYNYGANGLMGYGPMAMGLWLWAYGYRPKHGESPRRVDIALSQELLLASHTPSFKGPFG